MQNFSQRLGNVIANLNAARSSNHADASEQIDQGFADLAAIADEIDAYIPGFEDTEFDDFNLLNEINQRQGVKTDGLQDMLAEGLREAQKVILIRAAGRIWDVARKRQLKELAEVSN